MTMNNRWHAMMLTLFVCLLSANTFALELSRCFSDSMVLQREKPVKIWGTAEKNEAVAVNFAGQYQKTTADKDGKWAVTLKPMAANAKPQPLAVKAGKTLVTLKDVVVGDVFLFARQSSIDVTLGAKPDGKKLAEKMPSKKMLRFMRIVTTPSLKPLDNLGEKATKGWAALTKDNAMGMSTATFLLACELAGKTDVPLGFVDLDMGHHFAQAWLSEQGVQLAASKGSSFGTSNNKFQAWIKRWETSTWEGARYGFTPIERPSVASVCYNSVIHPMRGITLKGMILQLGNDYTMMAYNRLRAKGLLNDMTRLRVAWDQSYFAYKYGGKATPQVLPVAPDDLRRSLGDEALPIGWIMPPGSDFYDYAIHNREVRELQRRAQAETPGLDLILPGMKHVPFSGQPADESLLAHRCSQWVIATFYDKKAVATGPLFERFDYDGETAVGTIHFKVGTAVGLTAKGDVLDRFEVAAADGAFVPCKAAIEGTTIKLVGEDLPPMAFVRYNWSTKPAQGLVNGAGLPAVPFNTNMGWKYDWWPEGQPVKLPMEYHTTANKWPQRDIAIFSGANKPASGDSQPNPKDLGPTGIVAAPFGPNFYVHEVAQGSPADGKVFPGDIIYGVNGEEFTTGPDDNYRQFSAAITYSESYAGEGRFCLSIRRKGKLIEVPLKLEIMGSFSATTPYNCPKSRKIVAKAEKWMADGMRPAEGLPIGRHTSFYPYNTNFLFLLASANPKYQGLVRRRIYEKMKNFDPNAEVKPGGSNWNLGFDGLFFGEYYHRTGDKNVLPYLKYITDKISLHQYRPPGSDLKKYAVALTDEQTGGFYSGWIRFPGHGRTTYGLMAAAGMPCIMSLKLAKDAGVAIDEVSLQRGIRHFNYQRAENGFVAYSYGNLRRKNPKPIDPVREANGMCDSMNGKVSTAAALMKVVEDEGEYGRSVAICSRISVYAFNNTRHGHGGMFFNNFWTPIGAALSGEKGFQHFMKGQTWWRELYRRYDGSFSQVGRARNGVAFALHYVAHHKRLRILGAPRSAFSTNPPEYLKPALAAHAARDYALAVTLIQKELDERILGGEELRTVEHFLNSVQTLRDSIAYDLDYTESLLKQKRYYNAKRELPQLQGVVAPDNPRLIAIVKALETPEALADFKRVSKYYAQKKEKDKWQRRAKRNKPADTTWVSVVKDDGSSAKSGKPRKPTVVPEERSKWRMNILETQDKAPKDWFAPSFDDSSWDQVTLPIEWHISHAVLLRTTFTIEDKKAFDAMRIVGRYFKQRNVQVYLNGELVARANLGAPGAMPLTDYAMEVLKNGQNTLAITSQHYRRWHGSFTARLDVHKKEQ